MGCDAYLCLRGLSLNLPVIIGKETNMEEFILDENAGYICKLTKEDIALKC